ncbi:hypothetical protein AVEN_24961-1 [Araneus ventricosus]|uniref:Uncharacterized protein n=1 Tax=Araneus ventricosus TaxID=182803 RepID=A0A4Y2G7U3_ARAVE|nr:hypothetical protein AVEN_24961-1 [Araneus ventricosus]
MISFKASKSTKDDPKIWGDSASSGDIHAKEMRVLTRVNNHLNVHEIAEDIGIMGGRLAATSDYVYLVPTKVPYHPFNYRMAAAIFIRVVSRHGEVTMRYWMKPLTAPPGGKRWS